MGYSKEDKIIPLDKSHVLRRSNSLATRTLKDLEVFSRKPLVIIVDIFEAAKKGDISTLRRILWHSPGQANARKGDHTPLHLAAENGHSASVEILLLYRAEVDSRTGKKIQDKSEEYWEPGFTPLMLAARHGHIDVMDCLVAHGSDVNAKTSENWTALHAAVISGRVEGADILIKNGAEINAETSCQDFDESYGWMTHDTPLHLAAFRCDFSMAEFLLNHGANVDASDCCGRTPLFIAATNTDENMARLLVKYGARVDARISVSEAAMADPRNQAYLEVGATPLHYAVRGRLGEIDGFHDVNVIEFLISQGSDVNAVNRWGMSPLHIAAEEGHIEAIKTLLKHGADPKLRGIKDMTPLEIARYLDKKEVIDFLLKHTDDY